MYLSPGRRDSSFIPLRCVRISREIIERKQEALQEDGVIPLEMSAYRRFFQKHCHGDKDFAVCVAAHFVSMLMGDCRLQEGIRSPGE